MLSELNALPDWARELLESKTPYLASDPGLHIVNSHYQGKWVSVYARGFVYVIDRARQQVI